MSTSTSSAMALTFNLSMSSYSPPASRNALIARITTRPVLRRRPCSAFHCPTQSGHRNGPPLPPCSGSRTVNSPQPSQCAALILPHLVPRLCADVSRPQGAVLTVRNVRTMRTVPRGLIVRPHFSDIRIPLILSKPEDGSSAVWLVFDADKSSVLSRLQRPRVGVGLCVLDCSGVTRR